MKDYKVGDKVKIRKDLTAGTFYRNRPATERMASFAGQEVTIATVNGDIWKEYQIKEYLYKFHNAAFYTPEMFEEVDETIDDVLETIKNQEID